jgi:hypothetical protein
LFKYHDRVRLIPEFADLDVPMTGTVIDFSKSGDPGKPWVRVKWDSGHEATFAPEVLVRVDD